MHHVEKPQKQKLENTEEVKQITDGTEGNGILGDAWPSSSCESSSNKGLKFIRPMIQTICIEKPEPNYTNGAKALPSKIKGAEPNLYSFIRISKMHHQNQKT